MLQPNPKKKRSYLVRIFIKTSEELEIFQIITDFTGAAVIALIALKIGLAQQSEISELIFLGASGFIGAIIGFVFRLLFITPYKMDKEKEAEISKLAIQVESLQSPALEIESAPLEIKSAKWHPCQIVIHNKSSTKTADDVRVEMVSFDDEIKLSAQAAHFHPSFPLVLNPETQGKNTINPGGRIQYRMFRVSANSKPAIIKDGQIVGYEQKLMARFNSSDVIDNNMALFQCQKPYRMKLVVTARDFQKSEQEFNLIFVTITILIRKI